MSREFSKSQANQVAEKTAIIANTAFQLGRDSESTRIKQYIKEQLCDNCAKGERCELDNCYLLRDVIAFINSVGKHGKNEISLGDTNA